jgi:CRISPR-associated protein Csx17
MNSIILHGCRPQPLAGYLKSVGILRLLAEQGDRSVQGSWEGEFFCIRTNLNAAQCEDFFCEVYAPTPIVAPWNGGSGFYAGDAKEGINAILGSNEKRFERYRQLVSLIKSWPEMPKALETVDEILRTLSNALEGSPAGGKREIEKLLHEIETAAPLPGELEGRDPESMSFAELEEVSKQGKGQINHKLRTWMNAIKKARTRCSTLGRQKNKEAILPLCRSRLPESCLTWLDAVCAIHADGSLSYNWVLGSGGNDGRLELSNNFMQRLAELFIGGDEKKTRSLFRSSVFGEVTPGLIAAKIGYYDPGRAGGFNQGMEIETTDFKINPWDYILALEGSLLLAGAVVRRYQSDGFTSLTTPFTVKFSPVGFSSSEHGEAGRSETWLPIWRNPASYAEVKYVFSEGRSLVGRKMARTGVDFSRAVSTLGVDRGIDAFERYTFLKRRGDSYVALPAGRIPVRYRHGLDLLNELDALFVALDSFLRRFKNVTATYSSARRRIDEFIFSCTQHADPIHFGSLVRALGRMEQLIAFRDRSLDPALNRPLSGLSPRWIMHCDDGKPEVRIAAALAAVHSTGEVGPLRSNMAGVDPWRPWSWDQGKGQQHWYGSNLYERLAGVLNRRLMEGQRTSAKRTPVESFIALSPYDVMPFLLGGLDDRKLEELLWGFSLISWNKAGVKEIKKRWDRPVDLPVLSRTWCLLKLLHTPHEVQKKNIRRETRIAHLLQAGRVQEACSQAMHRLRVSGLKPFIVSYEEKLDPTRLAASMLITVKDQHILESLVLQQQNNNE